jgi:hypothetical protein
MNFGSAVHARVLDAGPEIVVVGDDLKTKAAQDLWKTTLGDFNIPLRTGQKQVADDMAAAVKQHRLAASLLDTDQTEISGWYTDQEAAPVVRRRARRLRDTGGRVPVCRSGEEAPISGVCVPDHRRTRSDRGATQSAGRRPVRGLPGIGCVAGIPGRDQRY